MLVGNIALYAGSIAPAPFRSEEMSFVKPYHGKNGLVDRLVYLNWPGSHFPIRPDNIFSWILIGMIVILLVAVLYLGVFTGEVKDRYFQNSKDGSPTDKNSIPGI